MAMVRCGTKAYQGAIRLPAGTYFGGEAGSRGRVRRRSVDWLCKVIGHKHARRVWHDGLDFRARCARCGGDMLRDSVRGNWRLFDPAEDANPARVNRPEHPAHPG